MWWYIKTGEIHGAKMETGLYIRSDFCAMELRPMYLECHCTKRYMLWA